MLSQYGAKDFPEGLVAAIRPLVQVARGELWAGPTRGFDLTTPFG
jgi:hypothetical protein